MDIALQYDPVKHRCDVVFNGTDFAVDNTQASAMLFSLFADRRAAPDDVLPDAVPDWGAPTTFIARRGWCGDFLDPLGRLTGSRFWLYVRSKWTEATRKAIEDCVVEALGWIDTERNLAVQVIVRLVAPNAIGILARQGKTTLSLTRALG